MHIYVHQMWLEGAFNMLNFSNHNSGEDLQESNLLNDYNHFNDEYVAPEVIDEHARKIKKSKARSVRQYTIQRGGRRSLNDCEFQGRMKCKGWHMPVNSEPSSFLSLPQIIQIPTLIICIAYVVVTELLKILIGHLKQGDSNTHTNHH